MQFQYVAGGSVSGKRFHYVLSVNVKSSPIRVIKKKPQIHIVQEEGEKKGGENEKEKHLAEMRN